MHKQGDEHQFPSQDPESMEESIRSFSNHAKPGTEEISKTFDAESAERPLHRAMKSRHVQMISIGGVIGTGLFLSTAQSLAIGGPFGLLLGYTVMGTIIWNVMASLGEMISHLPIPGGHVTLARRFVDPSLSFAMGWNYFYNWAILMPTEISAAAILINYWNKTINNGVWITIFLILVGMINTGGARFYAEFEFWFASIKVVAIVTLIIIGIVLDAGGGPDHDRIGFRYWHNPGAFVQYLGIEGSLGRFLGFWTVLIQASFSFIGTEITAITAGETKNPKKALPSAIKGVVGRIFGFYVMGTFIIGLLVPSNHPRLNLNSHDAASSPFVIAIENSGLKSLPSVINAALLTSAWSAASSDLYAASRALYGLALAGNAPRVLRKTTSWGLPWVSLAVSFSFGAPAYMSIGAGSGQVFTWLANMSGVTGLLTWVGILITYLRFDAGVEAQKLNRDQFPYKSTCRSYGAIYALVMCCVIILTNSYTVFMKGHWNTATFVTGYLPVLMAFVLYFGSKAYYKRRGDRVTILGLHEMDFITDSQDEARDGPSDVSDLGNKTFRQKFKEWC